MARHEMETVLGSIHAGQKLLMRGSRIVRPIEENRQL